MRNQLSNEELLLSVMFFSGYFQDSFFDFSFQQFDYDVSGVGFLWLYLVLSFLNFWIYRRFMSFDKSGKFLTIMYSNVFMYIIISSFFLGFQWYKDSSFIISEIPDILFTSSSFFKLNCSNWIIFTDLSKNLIFF